MDVCLDQPSGARDRDVIEPVLRVQSTGPKQHERIGQPPELARPRHHARSMPHLTLPLVERQQFIKL